MFAYCVCSWIKKQRIMKFCGFLFLMTPFPSQMAKKALKSESAASTTVKEDKQPAPEPVEKPPREPARWEGCPFVILGETLKWSIANRLFLRPESLSSSWWFDLLTCYWFWYKALWELLGTPWDREYWRRHVGPLTKVPQWLLLKGSFLLFLFLTCPYLLSIFCWY